MRFDVVITGGRLIDPASGIDGPRDDWRFFFILTGRL